MPLSERGQDLKDDHLWFVHDPQQPPGPPFVRAEAPLGTHEDARLGGASSNRNARCRRKAAADTQSAGATVSRRWHEPGCAAAVG